MKLYVRQKIFTIGDRFTVIDEGENPRFFVEGEIFALGKRLHIYDSANREVLYIQQKLFTFLPRYYILRGGQQIGELCKELSLFTPYYTVEGLGWEVRGDFFAHDYEITGSGGTVASINKAYFSFGDYYELDIYDERKAEEALAVALCIDCALERNSN